MIEVQGIRELNRKTAAMKAAMPNTVAYEFSREGQRTATEIKGIIETAPRVDLGHLLRGIHERTTRLAGGVETMVKPSDMSDRYAIFVEKDTRPHWPPIAAITPWALRHNMEPYLVARSIAKKGTKGIHMFERAFDSLSRRGDDLTNRIGAQMIKTFERG